MLARTIEALLGITLAANIFRFVSKRQLELVAYVMMAFNRLQSLLWLKEKDFVDDSLHVIVQHNGV